MPFRARNNARVTELKHQAERVVMVEDLSWPTDLLSYPHADAAQLNAFVKLDRPNPS